MELEEALRKDARIQKRCCSVTKKGLWTTGHGFFCLFCTRLYKSDHFQHFHTTLARKFLAPWLFFFISVDLAFWAAACSVDFAPGIATLSPGSLEEPDSCRSCFLMDLRLSFDFSRIHISWNTLTDWFLGRIHREKWLSKWGFQYSLGSTGTRSDFHTGANYHCKDRPKAKVGENRQRQLELLWVSFIFVLSGGTVDRGLDYQRVIDHIMPPSIMKKKPRIGLTEHTV